MQVTGLDHIVLNVADPAVAGSWYCERLGARWERREEWERGEVFFPSVRLDATTVIDLLQADRGDANVDHLCLVVTGVDLAEVASSGDFEVVSGPSALWGAQGDGTGLYVRDPDGNVVELRTYP